ncbi:DUSTY-like protein [Mya arenaria]|uniref:DUSTY-like protein n=1 Tax=Mya arenaria TaxID=6604 RepID=A0ABY7FXN7_MYAAR|nr:DUSTY-like protein [Mya arenaria]
MPWSQSPRIDDDWKKKVAAEMLASLSATRLAKSISSQIKDRLNKSHDAFLTALKQLEMKHSGRLTKIEEERLKLRKVHAPRVAKVALESTSLKDVILYGMPQMGREIGRGQYGVVYSCDSWASYTPCAIKSVVPPDEKHWNDLALEFFYTKNIPDHDRVVMLRGSVIDYSYGSGTPAVLLIMDRLQRDLYSAIKQNLDWVSRLQLDKDNRGKITDLGFCKPEAMMSGSIVGLRPEHLPVFDDECWDLMSNSWECEPAKRPLLGEVHATLQGIYDRYRNKPGGPTKTAKESPPKPLTQKNVKYKLKDKK